MNLATWTTTLAINALHGGGADVGRLGCWDWLLGCQHHEVHPFTGAEPGGWAWTDLSGGVPDADDTAGALLALAAWSDADPGHRQRAASAARQGALWLLNLQNRDGGWPTFCRGWGQLPFDRSGCDLSAHALRALDAWRQRFCQDATQRVGEPLERRISRAIQRGLGYLTTRQSVSGSWEPLWFGNQYDPGEQNLIYGTARVLLALRDLGLSGDPAARRGTAWLSGVQNGDGGWGAAPRSAGLPARSSVEETAVAVEALGGCAQSPAESEALDRGVQWLVGAVESDRHRDSSPIGFYFAKLWYYEALYPLIFTVAALGQAARDRRPQPAIPPSNRRQVCVQYRDLSEPKLWQPFPPIRPYPRPSRQRPQPPDRAGAIPAI